MDDILHDPEIGILLFTNDVDWTLLPNPAQCALYARDGAFFVRARRPGLDTWSEAEEIPVSERMLRRVWSHILWSTGRIL